MEIIKLSEPYQPSQLPKEPSVLALGFFDGVHLGHQKVIKTAKKIACERGLKLAVMTFDRQPKLMYQKHPKPALYLTLLARKLELFEQLGADIAYVVTFDEHLASMGPQEFVDKYMVGLSAQVVVAGQDYTYGKKELANMETLPSFAQGRFDIVAVDHLVLAASTSKVGSTAIRAYLDQGQVDQANELLGYPFQTKGLVVHGFARGRTIGFPTINLEIDPSQHLPAPGVYATQVELLGQTYLGMASVGYNETFGDNFDLTVEIYLLDFAKDVYGQEATVAWYHWLRPMVKFASVAELIDQLKADESNVRQYFANQTEK